MKNLQEMCRVRGLGTTPASRIVLVGHLSAAMTAENLEDGDDDEAEAIGINGLDVLTDMVQYEEAEEELTAEAVEAVVPVVEQAAADEAADDVTGHIDKFITYHAESDEIEVKWVGYSSDYNTIEPCWRLRVDIGEELF